MLVLILPCRIRFVGESVVWNGGARGCHIPRDCFSDSATVSKPKSTVRFVFVAVFCVSGGGGMGRNGCCEHSGDCVEKHRRGIRCVRSCRCSRRKLPEGIDEAIFAKFVPEQMGRVGEGRWACVVKGFAEFLDLLVALESCTCDLGGPAR